ncbi:uncharacterized protein TNCV_4026391 [Trichonephila clavipes]|nr:uncharacterized protein TNCV_4026391 [Trichonephila clavipes]
MCTPILVQYLDRNNVTESTLMSTRSLLFRANIHLLCQYHNFVAPFSMQLIKLLQVFGKLVGFYHGAARNVLFLVHTLMHGVGKGSIANVFEFWQRLQGHGK